MTDITTNALEICNGCDMRPMVPGDPGGYCAVCLAQGGSDYAKPEPEIVDPAFVPGHRFVRLYGYRMTVVGAESLLASALVNHDTHPDLVTLAATLAVENHRTVLFTETAELACTISGSRFDDEGWLR